MFLLHWLLRYSYNIILLCCRKLYRPILKYACWTCPRSFWGRLQTTDKRSQFRQSIQGRSKVRPDENKTFGHLWLAVPRQVRRVLETLSSIPIDWRNSHLFYPPPIHTPSRHAQMFTCLCRDASHATVGSLFQLQPQRTVGQHLHVRV